jgi:hypothetical protein
MELIDAYIKRDGISEEEAEEIVAELRARVWDGENPEDVLYEEGFEPDYVMDLITF